MIDGRLLAYRRGGIQRYVQALCDQFRRLQTDQDIRLVVNRCLEGPPLPAVKVMTPPHHRLETLSLGFEIALRRPSLFHSPDFIAPIVPGVPQVVTVHDLAFLKDPSLLSDDARRYYGQIQTSIHRASRIIAVSEATSRSLIEHLQVPPSRVRTIYNGVDPAVFETQQEDLNVVLRREFGDATAQRLSTGQPVLLIVGTVEPRKRHEIVIRALECMFGTLESPPLLVIAGQPGWQADHVVDLIRDYEQLGHIIWLQDASDAGLMALYRAATCLVMPSLDEGFGLPALEAMASGCPVIASNRGALPEVIANAGILVGDDDPECWASMISGLLADSDLRKDLSEQGTLRARQFRWEKTALATLEVYREVMTH